MIRRASEPTAKHPPKTEAAGLAQQKADFTSEGSPPPGQVATTPPATAAGARSAVPRAAATTVRANKRVPWGPSR